MITNSKILVLMDLAPGFFIRTKFLAPFLGETLVSIAYSYAEVQSRGHPNRLSPTSLIRL